MFVRMGATKNILNIVEVVEKDTFIAARNDVKYRL